MYIGEEVAWTTKLIWTLWRRGKPLALLAIQPVIIPTESE
jgi:hypothetical protein